MIAQAIPPPPEQIAADCAAPTYAIDHLVCADAELKDMDRVMRERLATLDPSFVRNPPPFIEDQISWFRRRSLCAFTPDGRACTQDAYAERLAVLGELRSDKRRLRAVECEGSLQGVKNVSINENLAVLTGVEGEVEVVTLLPDRHSSWRSFVQFSRSGTQLRFERVDGRKFVCH